ncbi:hypothetical protein [Amycolatopsis vastitatis]|uniref:VWFA domain-containing protein n=1 Tax=Amycolatopsis vastitatis TaxID=1905142 RepID=A0A229T244_9PSEU|nr:hypothetical protein [Amycolatopsis vastitatis]OXM65336.1 hypothetical protein CF165_23710 [Amycolatopsis vastitatis]
MIRPSRLSPGGLQASHLLGLTGSANAPAAALESDEVFYQLGDPGDPSPIPTLLIAVFDDSGSVTGRGGNDPLSKRYAEAEHAFQVVAGRGSPRELGAVLHFDSPCRGDVAPVPLTRRGMTALRRGLRFPTDAVGSSSLESSLRQATQLTEGYPGHATTLVVLSDFLLLDTDPAQVLSDLVTFPGDVHAVVMGSQVPDGVLAGGITVTPVTCDSRPGAVAEALFSSLVTHRPDSSAAAFAEDP